MQDKPTESDKDLVRDLLGQMPPEALKELRGHSKTAGRPKTSPIASSSGTARSAAAKTRATAMLIQRSRNSWSGTATSAANCGVPSVADCWIEILHHANAGPTPQTPNPKPQTPNPKPQTPNPFKSWSQNFGIVLVVD